MYKASIESFIQTFNVKENGTKLTHHSGVKFKLFPFIANNNSPVVEAATNIIGRYLSRIGGMEPVSITADELVKELKSETEIEPGQEELFDQIIRDLFFDKNGRLLPINLQMLAHVPCVESNECKLADYLVDVLGEKQFLKSCAEKATTDQKKQSNALEQYVLSVLKSNTPTATAYTPYSRIIETLTYPFNSDFEYILESRTRTQNDLIPLVEFYYFSYTAQTILQLDRFVFGERNLCKPLYFCLEWEKTSQNRKCFTEGWEMLKNAISQAFAHAITLEILNQTDEDAIYDYISLGEMARSSVEENQRLAEEIRRLTGLYRKAVSDCADMNNLPAPESPDNDVEGEIRYLFKCVKTQFEGTSRLRPYSAYADKFEKYCRKYLKRRGRSGMMLNISEETLIFLTKLCIKDHEKMRLNDVFAEFERRGVFLDNISKEQVMQYYEKLNLIEKKSDSGDAQYVKRIL